MPDLPPFAIGDTVRINNPDLSEYGAAGTVVKIDDNPFTRDLWPYGVDINGAFGWFDGDELELVSKFQAPDVDTATICAQALRTLAAKS